MPGQPIPRSGAIGVLTISLTLLGWTSVPLFLRHFAESIDVWTSNGWRYGFSAMLWAPVLVVGAWRHRLPAGLWRAAVVPSLINVLGQITFAWSHYKIDPGLLTFGLRSQMVFVAVGAYLMFPGERRVVLAPAYLVGMVAVIVGTAGAVTLGAEPFRASQVAGVAMSIVSGLFFALYGLAVRKYMHGMGSVFAFAAISQYTAFLLVGMMLVWGADAGGAALRMPADQVALLLASAVVGIALGHVLYYMSIARLGVVISAGVLQLHPFFVAVGSLLLFHEQLTVRQWIGGGVAMAGALLMLTVQGRLSIPARSTPEPHERGSPS